MRQPIQAHLSRIRKMAILHDSRTIIWIVYCCVVAYGWLLIVLESLFYFSTELRTAMWMLAMGLLGLLATGILGFGISLAQNRLPRYSWTTLARKTGQLVFPKPDLLINALQLERDPGTGSQELAQAYISSIDNKISAVNPASLFPSLTREKWKYRTFTVLGLLAIFILITTDASGGAIYRWFHPRTEFIIPTPFTLKSVTGDIQLLGGDPAGIVIEAENGRPDSVYLELQGPESIPVQTLAAGIDSTGLYRFRIPEVFSDYTYRAFVPSTHFWEPWDRITTPDYHIMVTDRPLAEAFTITVIPPEYARLEPTVTTANQANIQGLKGSRIVVKFHSNRTIQNGFIQVGTKKIPLAITGQYAEGKFTLTDETIFTTHFYDRRGISNRDPIPYHLQLLPDNAPAMIVIEPKQSVDLGTDMEIPIRLSIEDDFGFSNLQVGYEVRRPSYLHTEPYISIFSIRLQDPFKLSQEIRTFWNLAKLNLMPEDEVHYHFEVYDNDVVSGPKKFVTGNYIARVPSLADLFDTMEESQADIFQDAAQRLDEVKGLQEQLDKLNLELIKSDKMNWDQEQAVRQSLESVREEVARLKELSERLNAMSELGEKHGLFSPQLMEKFQKLQQLVTAVFSEDFLQDIEQVQKALEAMDLDDLKSALESLAANLDQVEENLDRYIDIFKRIQAEQKLAEVMNRLGQLEKQQESLNRQIADMKPQADASDWSRLKQEEARNLAELENILDVMSEAAEDIQPFSPESAQNLAELAKSDLANLSKSDLRQTMSQLGRQQSQSRESSRAALKDIRDLESLAEQIQRQFQTETGSDMAARFNAILRDLLSVSKAQEALEQTTSQTSRSSPRLRDLAGQQQNLRDQLTRVMSQLMALSRETFAVTPEMGRLLGSAYGAMGQAQQQLTERDSRTASNNQGTAMESMNQAAMILYQTAQQMQSGQGSASGFEQFLQRMGEMAGQQQGINQQGLQLALGQMATSLQQGLLQRMLSDQQQVRKSLDQLMQEMSGSGKKGLGDLSGISSEMDEVIKDLQRGQYTRKTQLRQEKILSRMLDSQKSLTQRGQKEERRSTTAASGVSYASPGGLPEDRGQRRSLTLEALNRALKAGYSTDYQDMIRRYFNTLTQIDFPIENITPTTKKEKSP